jgi:hypothetical protein
LQGGSHGFESRHLHLVVVSPVSLAGRRMYLTNRIGKLLFMRTATPRRKERKKKKAREVSNSPHHGNKLLRAYGGCLGAKCR